MNASVRQWTLVAGLTGQTRRSWVSPANHTGNYGRDALVETITTLDKAGIPRAGAGRNIDEAWAPVLFIVRGRVAQRVADLSAALGTTLNQEGSRVLST